MKTFAVWIVVNGQDRRIGKVTATSESHAYGLVPKKWKDMGKVILVPVVIES